MWANFGKQNWQCGMNQKLDKSAQVLTNETPLTMFIGIDSRSVAMEVGIR
jgi:hypothetical protein